MLTFDAAPQRVAAVASEDPSTPATSFTAIGYRQTADAAAKGGTPNSNGFRFRHQAMRAIARTFRGTPFISGHNWGDVRARGGTNVDAWADAIAGAPSTDLGFYYKVELAAPWAIEALANGTLDRFSMGAQPRGEITCTVHGSPVWEDCYCWPLLEVDGKLVEWEYDDAVGVELSGVNVPAVGGTSIVEIHASATRAPAPPNAQQLAVLSKLCGRVIPKSATAVTVDLGARPSRGSTPSPAPITMTPDAEPRSASMKWWENLAKELGLPADATEADVTAAIKANARDLGALRSEVDQSHVESSIAALRASHKVNDKTVANLRAKFEQGGRGAFDEQLGVIADAAEPLTAAAPSPVATAATTPPTPAKHPLALAAGVSPTTRGTLQSDAPVVDPLTATAEDSLDGPDCYEQSKGSPLALRFFRWAGLTAADVKKHGPRTLAVQPDLVKLIAQAA